MRQAPLLSLLLRLSSLDALDQAPWPALRICSLLDSMYRGYPIGHVAIWPRHRWRGPGATQTVRPGGRVLDGAGRLGGLALALLGQNRPGLGGIAFHPGSATFVPGLLELKDNPEYVPDISVFFRPSTPRFTLVGLFLDRLEAGPGLTPGEREQVGTRIDRLAGLARYPVTVFEFAASASGEEVMHAAARMGSGKAALTLEEMILAETGCASPGLSRELYRFCLDSARPAKDNGPSSFNHILRAEPQDIITAALFAAKAPAAAQVRDEGPPCAAITTAMDLTNWHGFLTALAKSGFRGRGLVASRRAAFAAYGHYLRLRGRDLEPEERDALAGQLYFGLSLCGRDLSRALARQKAGGGLRGLEHGQAIKRALDEVLTTAFFAEVLPGLLSRPGVKTAAFLAYLAAQTKLGALVLFSTARTGDLLDLGQRLGKCALERHHIHPRAHLRDQGVAKAQAIDRPGNLALVEWPRNLAIGDEPPRGYLPRIRRRFAPEFWETMLTHNALWPGFEHLEYGEFCRRRVRLMARIIELAFGSCSAGGETPWRL